MKDKRQGKKPTTGQTSWQGKKQPNKVLLWFRITRPQTLFASLCPVLTGVLVTHKYIAYTGTQGAVVATLTALCALALQILSNLINDYYDFRRGTDKQGRAGFRRALAEGEVTESEMKAACYVTLGIAVVLGAVLVYVGGWVILAIGLTAILFAWLYTATNHSLSYMGVADIFVFLYYGIIATAGTVYLQFRAVGMRMVWEQMETALYAGAVCGLISMCVLAINNIRDMDSDREAGKKTFPVRFGKTAALVGLGVIAALMPLFAWLAFGMSWAMGVVVPAGILVYEVTKAKGKEYNECLLAAGVVNLCYVVLVWITI